jgi:hypothetical protein
MTRAELDGKNFGARAGGDRGGSDETMEKPPLVISAEDQGL